LGEGGWRGNFAWRHALAALLVVVAAGALSAIPLWGSEAGAAPAPYNYCPGPYTYQYQYCEPPDCSAVTATPSTLWPPNHKLVLVKLSGATDPQGGDVTIEITGVTQDEPLNGVADGNTSPDAGPGPTSNSVFLRAERSGQGDGRVYTISFTATNELGASCSGTVTVGVSHDRGQHATPIDSAPPSYNSFGP
jgi:hypothetical protein